MKTKAFSKEGLGQSAKQDPRERARAEIREWLNTTVDTLNLQVRQDAAKLRSVRMCGNGRAASECCRCPQCVHTLVIFMF